MDRCVNLLSGGFASEMVRYIESNLGTLSSEDKLALLLTQQFRHAGHVCMPAGRSMKDLVRLLDLDDHLITLLPNRPLELKESKIVGKPTEKKPFVLHGGNIYQSRFYSDEQALMKWIDERSTSERGQLSEQSIETLNDLFKESDLNPDWQKVAVALSALKPFLIISGGPGTGKTTTVARILALQIRMADTPLRIALAAPTGKAAGRMAEALSSEMQKLDLTEMERNRYPKEAQTIHRMLRGVETRGLLPPVREKKLPYDLIIIDEASMIDLSLMHRLVKHIGPDTSLILLGDKNQLASVEAGSVFADLCGKQSNVFKVDTINSLQSCGIALDAEGHQKELSPADDSIVYLTKSYRFHSESGIGALAEAVNKGIENVAELEGLLTSYSDISAEPFGYRSDDFKSLMLHLTNRLSEASVLEDAEEMLEFWKKEMWLTVLRRGLAGSDRLNQFTEQSLASKRLVKMNNGWYHGRPIIVTQNDYDTGVFNGDFGVCAKLQTGEDAPLMVFIQSGTEVKMVRPERLRYVKPGYFLTVHKSQGSEFGSVNLLMPKDRVPVLTRELLYTAVTRSRNSFELYGSKSLFVMGSQNRTERFSGIRSSPEGGKKK